MGELGAFLKIHRVGFEKRDPHWHGAMEHVVTSASHACEREPTEPRNISSTASDRLHTRC